MHTCAHVSLCKSHASYAFHRALPTFICTHTHTHTHTHSLSNTHKHAHIYVYIHTYTHIYIYKYAHTCIYTCIHIHIHTHTDKYKYIDIYSYIHTCVCMYVYVPFQSICDVCRTRYRLETGLETSDPLHPFVSPSQRPKVHGNRPCRTTQGWSWLVFINDTRCKQGFHASPL
jgi:hypothetical protein